MQIPRLGVSRSYSCQPTPEPQQHRIWAPPATYTTAPGNPRSLTHWARPGIEPETSWFQSMVHGLFPLHHNRSSNFGNLYSCFSNASCKCYTAEKMVLINSKKKKKYTYVYLRRLGEKLQFSGCPQCIHTCCVFGAKQTPIQFKFLLFHLVALSSWTNDSSSAEDTYPYTGILWG